jgi:hypothetical protein
MILIALIASIYLLWITLYNLYSSYCKGKAFIVGTDKQVEAGEREAERMRSMRDRKTQRSMVSKSKLSQYGGSKAVIGAAGY